MISFSRLKELRGPMIIAHRGASGEMHQNTLPAFKRAIELGADAIELDVRRTGDGVLVVHHDRSIRPSGPSIARRSYTDCVKMARSQGYSLPTLKDTLELCADNISLDIELKEPGYEEHLHAMVSEYYDLDCIVFTSFRASSLMRIRKYSPKAVTGLLIGLMPQVVSRSTNMGVSALTRVKRCHANFLAADWRLLRFGLLGRVRKAGVPVIAWTVNRSPSARRLARLGVAGIITDYPDRIRSAANRAQVKRRLRIGRRRR